jgi:hypothetical protein
MVRAALVKAGKVHHWRHGWIWVGPGVDPRLHGHLADYHRSMSRGQFQEAAHHLQVGSMGADRATASRLAEHATQIARNAPGPTGRVSAAERATHESYAAAHAAAGAGRHDEARAHLEHAAGSAPNNLSRETIAGHLGHPAPVKAKPAAKVPAATHVRAIIDSHTHDEANGHAAKLKGAELEEALRLAGVDNRRGTVAERRNDLVHRLAGNSINSATIRHGWAGDPAAFEADRAKYRERMHAEVTGRLGPPAASRVKERGHVTAAEYQMRVQAMRPAAPPTEATVRAIIDAKTTDEALAHAGKLKGNDLTEALRLAGVPSRGGSAEQRRRDLVSHLSSGPRGFHEMGAYGTGSEADQKLADVQARLHAEVNHRLPPQEFPAEEHKPLHDPMDTPLTAAGHIAAAHQATAAGRHQEAKDHLDQALTLAPDKKTRDQVLGHLKDAQDARVRAGQHSYWTPPAPPKKWYTHNEARPGQDHSALRHPSQRAAYEQVAADAAAGHPHTHVLVDDGKERHGGARGPQLYETIHHPEGGAPAEPPMTAVGHMDAANTAIRHGDLATAINHLTAAEGKTTDKKTRANIRAARARLAAAAMGKPASTARPRKLTEGERISADLVAARREAFQRQHGHLTAAEHEAAAVAAGRQGRRLTGSAGGRQLALAADHAAAARELRAAEHGAGAPSADDLRGRSSAELRRIAAAEGVPLPRRGSPDQLAQVIRDVRYNREHGGARVFATTPTAGGAATERPTRYGALTTQNLRDKIDSPRTSAGARAEMQRELSIRTGRDTAAQDRLRDLVQGPTAPAAVDESAPLRGDPEGDNMRMHGDSVTMGLARAYAAAGRNGSANRMMDLRRRATTPGPDRITPQAVVDELRALHAQEQDPRLKAQLDQAISAVDAPQRALPDIPENTPPHALRLIQELNAIPHARKRDGERAGAGHIEGPSLVEQVGQVYRDAAAGERGDSGRSPIDRIRNILRDKTHESNEAAFHLWSMADALETVEGPNGREASPLSRELRAWERGQLPADQIAQAQGRLVEATHRQRLAARHDPAGYASVSAERYSAAADLAALQQAGEPRLTEQQHLDAALTALRSGDSGTAARHLEARGGQLSAVENAARARDVITESAAASRRKPVSAQAAVSSITDSSSYAEAVQHAAGLRGAALDEALRQTGTTARFRTADDKRRHLVELLYGRNADSLAIERLVQDRRRGAPKGFGFVDLVRANL